MDNSVFYRKKNNSVFYRNKDNSVFLERCITLYFLKRWITLYFIEKRITLYFIDLSRTSNGHHFRRYCTLLQCAIVALVSGGAGLMRVGGGEGVIGFSIMRFPLG